MHFLRAFLPFRVSPSRADLAPLVLRDRNGRQLVRRRDRQTQPLRRGVQVAFALLNVWIGVEFYRWVRFYETGGATVRVERPAGVEGWLPIAALMNLKYWVTTWEVPELHASGLFLLVAFLAMSWLLRKAFCSWLCPIGTLSEILWEGGQALFGRSLRPPRWLDIPLRSLKYVLFGLFAYAVLSMPAEGIVAFLRSPYGLVADVKMLDFFRHMGTTGAVVIGLLLLVSVVVQNAWCRYLCPYGAMLGLVALVSPTRIRRDADGVHRLREVRQGVSRRPAGGPACRASVRPSARTACCASRRAPPRPRSAAPRWAAAR